MLETPLCLGAGFLLPGDEPPFERTAEWMCEQEFTGLMITPNPSWSDAQTERVGAVFRDRDIAIYEVASYTSLVHDNPTTRRMNIDAVKRRVEQAAIVGALSVATVGGSAAGWAPHPKTRTTEAWDLLLDATHEILDATPDTVSFCLEPWPPTVLPDLDSLVRVVDEVEDDRLGILFDPANLVTPETYFTSGEMIREAFDRLGDRFVAVHCKDVYWLEGGMQTGLGVTVPGRGVLDYQAFLSRVASSARELPLIIEHLKQPEEVIAAAAFIRQQASALNLQIN